MKTRIYLLITYMILLGSNCRKAQDNAIEKQSIAMLKEFYTSYSSLKFIAKDLQKIDSLQKKYCSISERKELKEEFRANGLDHDLLTNDHGIDAKSLKTLTIIKSTTKTNDYIVSYLIQTLSAANKPIQEKVILHVTIIKENGSFKIASVL
jgi:hypothetical protein